MKSARQIQRAAHYLANREQIILQEASYRAANTERVAARHARYYLASRERIILQQASYRAANTERVAARHAAHYLANREQRAATSAAYYAENRAVALIKLKASRSGASVTKKSARFFQALNLAAQLKNKNIK